MTTKMIEVLDPTTQVVGGELGLAPRTSDLNGKVLGLLDNDKPNFDIFLSRIEELLCQNFKFAEVVRVKKGTGGGGGAALPCPVDDLERFAATCDIAITGMGD